MVCAVQIARIPRQRFAVGRKTGGEQFHDDSPDFQRLLKDVGAHVVERSAAAQLPKPSTRGAGAD